VISCVVNLQLEVIILSEIAVSVRKLQVAAPPTFLTPDAAAGESYVTDRSC